MEVTFFATIHLAIFLIIGSLAITRGQSESEVSFADFILGNVFLRGLSSGGKEYNDAEEAEWAYSGCVKWWRLNKGDVCGNATERIEWDLEDLKENYTYIYDIPTSLFQKVLRYQCQGRDKCNRIIRKFGVLVPVCSCAYDDMGFDLCFQIAQTFNHSCDLEINKYRSFFLNSTLDFIQLTERGRRLRPTSAQTTSTAAMSGPPGPSNSTPSTTNSPSPTNSEVSTVPTLSSPSTCKSDSERFNLSATIFVILFIVAMAK